MNCVISFTSFDLETTILYCVSYLTRINNVSETVVLFPILSCVTTERSVVKL